MPKSRMWLLVALCLVLGGNYGLCQAPGGICTTIQAKLTAGDAAFGDVLGNASAIDGDTLVIGATGDDDNGSESGSAYVFVRQGAGWVQEAKLVASDGAATDNFGVSVAVSGSTILVGANGNDDAGTFSGSAYIFTKESGAWVQQVKLLAPDATQEDAFGQAVSLDGGTAVIGAPGDGDLGFRTGSAYVYVRTMMGWVLQAKLVASDFETDSAFGVSVSVDGDSLLVGSWTNDAPLFDSGSAYVFTRSLGVWSEDAKLVPGDPTPAKRFGGAVSLDGVRTLIGTATSREAYVFERVGPAWVEQARLEDPAAGSNDFGASVALLGDLAVIGARGDDAGGMDAGAAYVFHGSGGAWVGSGKLFANDADTGDVFGWSVAISGDTIVVGSLKDDLPPQDAGSAYVFLVDHGSPVGMSFCLGDGSNGICPCGNPAAACEGCKNGTGRGGRLIGEGSASITSGNLVMRAGQVSAGQPGLFFQGNNSINGGDGVQFGDGLRCAGGGLVRLEIVTADGSGAALSTVPIASTGGVTPGDTKYYQWWYRDPTGSPCGNGFNLSNGLEVTWAP